MTNEPEFDLKVTKDEIVAAMERQDYEWLVENVFTPALTQFLRKQNTAALVKGSTLPRSRRPAGTRRHRNHRIRRSHEVPG